jgi:hypothetical protein
MLGGPTMQQLTPYALSWKVRLAILLPLLAMASLPLFVYFQFEHEHILLWMWLILIVVQMVLSLRTARLAISMMASIRKHDGKHIQLTLTEAEAKTFPYDVFKAVIRATWIDHVMLALPRLSVALAFAEYFHTSYISSMTLSDVIFNARPFLYVSHNPAHMMYPDILQVIIALIILMTFCISEGAISTAFGILWGILVRGRNTIDFVIISRVIICCIALTSFMVAMEQRAPNIVEKSALIRKYVTVCEDFDQFQRRAEQCDSKEWKLISLRITESGQVTITSFFDQGILLTSNIMITSMFYYIDGKFYLEEFFPFMIRNILSALLAFAIYGVIIWSSLRIARNRLISAA